MKLHAALLSVNLVLAREALDKPNFIMLFMDDLGYGDPGFKGHPTTKTPNLDALAYGGKKLNTWYSGCPVCSGSRAALMTGRQYTRTGVPGVFGPTVGDGLNLNETTLANQLKKAGYHTGMIGKWHLGQRRVYLPANRGFDEYLGIPYSDDMGQARYSPCGNASESYVLTKMPEHEPFPSFLDYLNEGDSRHSDGNGNDPAGEWLPLVRQSTLSDGTVNTTVLEQPLDLTTLGSKYGDFVTDFISSHANEPFFLYAPFSHVHTTSGGPFQNQFAGCTFQNSTVRGHFGDALAEADHIVGQIIDTLKKNDIQQNTLIVFSSDNGPWMVQAQSAGSVGHLYARSAGYWNVGKGSTWEGGIREAAFAHWEGTITPFSSTSEVVSSLDVLPTFSKLAGVPLPSAVLDGKDMSDVLLKDDGKSPHDFLWFYEGSPKFNGKNVQGPTAVRYGAYKAYYVTAPGLGGCTNCTTKYYEKYAPLLFDVLIDPSEQFPLTNGPIAVAIGAAFDQEVATFVPGRLIQAPDEPGEGPDKYGVCCDRAKSCMCTPK